MPRERLWSQLDQATAGAVTMLVAPSGAGKTLGVSGWVRRLVEQDDHPDVRWVQADHGWDASAVESLLDGDHAEPPLVVIDDAHQLSAGALRFIDGRLNEAPQSLRLLLLTRWDLGLSRLVPEMLGHFTMIRGEVLRMEDEEATALIAEHARTSSPQVAAAIIERAQGWCAAVVLTARAAGSAPDPVAAVARLVDTGTRVGDRIATEAFSALRPRERHLLLCAAIEPMVSVDTAIHLSHNPDAGEILDDLETTGLLVSRVEGPREEYRIHPILAEIIRRRLVAGGVDVIRARATVTRAVRLDLARGDSTRAFGRLVAVQEHDAAAQVLVEHGVDLVLRGQGPSIKEFVRHHADAVDAVPDAWFALALERWVNNDADGAIHWIDRSLAHHRDDGEKPGSGGAARVACLRLMRSRLGLETVPAAVEHAQHVVSSRWGDPGGGTTDGSVLPVLLTELGITQNWVGDLTKAEVNLTTAISLCRNRHLPTLAATATSHLAVTQYAAGREQVCRQLATEAITAVPGTYAPQIPRFTAARASLVLQLTDHDSRPWAGRGPHALSGEPVPVQASDLVTRFWVRMRDARLALLDGHASEAERILETPLDLPLAVDRLPRHLQVALQVERALVAALSADRNALRLHELELVEIHAPAEAALVSGLRADLDGDRQLALGRFEESSAHESSPQPASLALALVCQAQLLDALGSPDAALERLREAAIATEVRRTAIAFLGWSRQGTPMVPLLDRLADVTSSAWVQELREAAGGRPDVATSFAARTLTPRERSVAGADAVRATLSPREREVLNELARGSTYADIAANLYVSENTVKTHVSSLYGKLAVSRRSEALAVGRRLHLL